MRAMSQGEEIPNVIEDISRRALKRRSLLVDVVIKI